MCIKCRIVWTSANRAISRNFLTSFKMYRNWTHFAHTEFKLKLNGDCIEIRMCWASEWRHLSWIQTRYICRVVLIPFNITCTIIKLSISTRGNVIWFGITYFMTTVPLSNINSNYNHITNPISVSFPKSLYFCLVYQIFVALLRMESHLQYFEYE